MSAVVRGRVRLYGIGRRQEQAFAEDAPAVSGLGLVHAAGAETNDPFHLQPPLYLRSVHELANNSSTGRQHGILIDCCAVRMPYQKIQRARRSKSPPRMP